jgi:sigma-B regulation protein RsbU (phosphoserine phosphatase)
VVRGRWGTWRRESTVVTAALVAGLAIVVADLLSPPSVNYTTLLVVVPMIATTVCRPRRTLALGAASLVVGAGLLVADDVSRTEGVVRILGVATAAAVATLLSSARVRREQRLDDLDSFATIAQELILRPVPPRLGNVYAAGRYVAASDVLAVGGDLYDVALTTSGVRFIIGDACGKGLNGIRLAGQVLARFREAVFVEASLQELAKRLDELVAEIAGRSGRDVEFVTAVIGELREDGTLMIANCGHPDGLLARQGEVALLSPPARTVPLGLGADPSLHRVEVKVGDRLLWWTDGVSEARDAGGDFLEVEQAAVRMATSATLEVGLDALLKTVRTHATGHLLDDVALLGFELGASREHKPWLQSVLADRREAVEEAQAQVQASHARTPSPRR